MAKMGLFKTKEEKRAYAIGRRHQYNKEHPLTNYVVRATHYSLNEDGTLFGKYTVDGSRHRTSKEATEMCRKSNETAKWQRERVLAAAKRKKVNVHSSEDSTYTTYEVVRDRKRV